jgi:hypothetical protein
MPRKCRVGEGGGGGQPVRCDTRKCAQPGNRAVAKDRHACIHALRKTTLVVCVGSARARPLTRIPHAVAAPLVASSVFLRVLAGPRQSPRVGGIDLQTIPPPRVEYPPSPPLSNALASGWAASLATRCRLRVCTRSGAAAGYGGAQLLRPRRGRSRACAREPGSSAGNVSHGGYSLQCWPQGAVARRRLLLMLVAGRHCNVCDDVAK